MKILKLEIENTGGNMIVAYGEFDEGYFGGLMNEDITITDESFDEYMSSEFSDDTFFVEHTTKVLPLLGEDTYKMWTLIYDFAEENKLMDKFHLDFWRNDLKEFYRRTEL